MFINKQVKKRGKGVRIWYWLIYHFSVRCTFMKATSAQIVPLIFILSLVCFYFYTFIPYLVSIVDTECSGLTTKDRNYS